MLAPVIQDARRDSRKATTSATSSARPSRPSGNWVARKSANTAGLSLPNVSPGPAGKQDGAGADGIYPDAPGRELGGGGRSEVDLGRLGDRIVGPRRRAHAGDRGDDDHGTLSRRAQ